MYYQKQQWEYNYTWHKVFVVKWRSNLIHVMQIKATMSSQVVYKKKIEDTKGNIIIHKSNKERQYNSHKKGTKRPTMTNNTNDIRRVAIKRHLTSYVLDTLCDQVCQ